jgi:hypothetical protein
MFSKIKFVFLVLAACVQFMFMPMTAWAEAEVKEVCHDKIDVKTGKPATGKDGKVVQECKKIKVHKKLEGTKIEDAKKSK